MKKVSLLFVNLFLVLSINSLSQVNTTTIKWTGENFDNAVGNFFPDLSTGINFFTSDYSNSKLDFYNSEEHVEGSGSMLVDYKVAANGWIVRTTYDIYQQNVLPYLDLSDGTHLSFWYKILQPVTYSQENNNFFDIKLKELDDLGHQEMWVQRTDLDLSDATSNWINVVLPLKQSSDAQLGFNIQFGDGDGILQFSKIKGFEFVIANEGSSLSPYLEGSFLIDDMRVIVDVKTALNNINLMIDNLTLSQGLKSSLSKKINQAITNYDKNKLNVVKNILIDFIGQINDFISENKISSDEGQNLINKSNIIINFISSGLNKYNNNGNYIFNSNSNQLSIPTQFGLSQNYPNPFNPSTKINWQSPESGSQSIKIYDALGNEVATLVDELKPAGNYEVEFNAENIPSGVYFYQLIVGDFVQTRKMILMK